MSEKLNIERDKVKIMFYIWTYGGRQRVMEEGGIAITEIERFIEYIKSNTTLLKLSEKFETGVDGKYVTPPTPLGHQFPIFRKYHALPIFIQATAAEIMALWIKELSNADLLRFIVNVIHDEIIFEIPINFNLYDVASEIYRALSKTTSELTPNCELKLNFSSSPSWDTTNSTTIITLPTNS